jgi:hypothetical protein
MNIRVHNYEEFVTYLITLESLQRADHNDQFSLSPKIRKALKDNTLTLPRTGAENAVVPLQNPPKQMDLPIVQVVGYP